MKKIIVALLLLTMSSACYGAVSDDVYVRKDVFDAKMEAMFNRLHGDIQALSERMDGNFAALSRRMDGLDKRMDGFIDDLQHYLYLVLVLLGIIVALPSVQKMLQWREERKEARKSSITLEDVERLIDARMAGKAQA